MEDSEKHNLVETGSIDPEGQAIPTMDDGLIDLLAKEKLPSSYRGTVIKYVIPLAQILANKSTIQTHPLIVGINGAQGSGKSTLCLFLKNILERTHGLHTTILSIDDLYLNRSERKKLAETIHPLLATRGVPGTHQIKEGISLLNKVRDKQTLTLPRFDKSKDEPKPKEEWETTTQPAEILLFEGWCIAARPQSAEALELPINSLEAEEDADGTWRRYVNDQLQNEYADLFVELDFLIHLKAPSFDCVYEWRSEQEQKLAERSEAQAPGLMVDAALERFIKHYESLTREMLDEMHQRADVTLHLNADHSLKNMSAL